MLGHVRTQPIDFPRNQLRLEQSTRECTFLKRNDSGRLWDLGWSKWTNRIPIFGSTIRKIQFCWVPKWIGYDWMILDGFLLGSPSFLNQPIHPTCQNHSSETRRHAGLSHAPGCGNRRTAMVVPIAAGWFIMEKSMANPT